MKRKIEYKCAYCKCKIESRTGHFRRFCCKEHQLRFQVENHKRRRDALKTAKTQTKECEFDECNKIFEYIDKRRRFCSKECRVLEVQQRRKKQRKFNIIVPVGKMRKTEYHHFEVGTEITRQDIEQATREFLRKKGKITRIETPVYMENPFEKEYFRGVFITLQRIDEL